MGDRWVHNKTNTAYISRRNLLYTNDECTVIHLSYVAPSVLGLLQSKKFENLTRSAAPRRACRSASVDCSRVVSTQSETVSMVQNQWRPEQPEICSLLTDRHTVRQSPTKRPPMTGLAFPTGRCPTYVDRGATSRHFAREVGMSDVSNNEQRWLTLHITANVQASSPSSEPKAEEAALL
ncbi:hypothetical protein RB195_019221 [Necator americanus]|uniref:Uncharacterized protein n=1 Tax=Necator americanus TaxID=51031 RepID=A0ABR1CE66_NECAM